MSESEMAGQALLLSFAGTTPSAELRTALARTRAAGVILFRANIAGPEQLSELCATLQTWAAAEGLPPLLIGIDQEGGTVSRLPEPFVTPPSQLAQGAAGSPDDAYACALLTGRQLRACGVNLNFAPLADVNSNPANPVIGIRSFGADPGMVGAFVAAALRGYAEAGVIACVKHFPGHGDTNVDSHLGLPVVEHDAERIARVELAPFAAAVGAGAHAIMSAHVVFRALDPRPATLAPPVLRGVLRKRLGFDGLVFTDALDMRAIADSYGAPEAAILARQAGADIVIPLGPLAGQVAVAEALGAAYASGRLSPTDGQATLRRLASVRAAFRLGEPAAPGGLTSAVLTTLDAIAMGVARRGTTVRDPGGALPLDRTTELAVIECRQLRFNNAEDAAERSVLLCDRMGAAFPRAVFLSVSEQVADGELDAALAVAARTAWNVLLTRNAVMAPAQARLAAALANYGPRLIHVAARSPEDVALLRGAAVSICTYGDPPVSMRALVAALRGAEE
jgi:beta-N-acetylhexosaminidase